MQKIRPGNWLWLILAGLLTLALGVSQAGAQLNFLDRSWGDYTWGVYGGDREYSRQGREDLVARENYCPSGGCVLRLEGVEVRPPKARGGQTLTLSTTYTILTPDGVAIPVAITRQIFFQGNSLGQTKSMEMRNLNGTWTQDVDFTLPADARPGVYTLNTKVTTGYGLDQKEVQLRVE